MSTVDLASTYTIRSQGSFKSGFHTTSTMGICQIVGDLAKEVGKADVLSYKGNNYVVWSAETGAVSTDYNTLITVFFENEQAASTFKNENFYSNNSGWKKVSSADGIDSFADNKSMVLKDFESAMANNNADGVTPKAIAKAEDFKDQGLMTFNQMIESRGFQARMNNSWNADGNATIHDYITRNIARYYAQMYYVPNLRSLDCTEKERKPMCILVKPETLFISIPSCNIVFPTIKSEINFSRPLKMEPTRILQITDPIVGLSGGNASGGPVHLTAMMFLEEEGTGENDAYGMPQYKQYVKAAAEYDSVVKKTAKPLTLITGYESRNGIYGTTVAQGMDTYLYIVGAASGNHSETASDGKGGTTTKDTYQITIPSGSSASNATTTGNALGALARYTLLKQRYAMRTGTVQMYFNPYIVPGFPFVSIESTKSSCNIYGYVTNVVHNITDRSWSTTVSFNSARFDTEVVPGAFPLVENEYVTGIADTYHKMLGETVAAVNNADIPGIIESYKTGDKSVSTSLHKIWRETPSMEEYAKYIADDATIIHEVRYSYFSNRNGASFFDDTLQARIKSYTESVVKEHTPFTTDDVR